jgi:hypothetical protein
VVELVTPPVLPVAPGVLLDEVSEPVVLPGVAPVPEAPIELVPPVLPVVEPLAEVSVLDVLPVVLPVPPAVVDGLVDGVDAVGGVVVVVVEVVLSVLSFFVQAPSDRAAAIANTAAAVWVRDVFIRETP